MANNILLGSSHQIRSILNGTSAGSATNAVGAGDIGGESSAERTERLGVLGNLFSGLMGDSYASYARLQNACNEFARSEADRAWDRQLYLSNTSYQRAVEDLKAAGLSPLLAYQNGGASSGSAPMGHSRAGGQVKTGKDILGPILGLIGAVAVASINSSAVIARSAIKSSGTSSALASFGSSASRASSYMTDRGSRAGKLAGGSSFDVKDFMARALKRSYE